MIPQAVPLDRLQPAPWNPRILREKRFRDLCASLTADPGLLERRPILANAQGIIYAGNQRFRAAQHLGWTTVPAVLDDITDAEAKARSVRDNAAAGEWNEDQYGELLHELRQSGVSLASLGADAAEVERLLAGVGGGIEEDVIPEPPAEPITRPGDLWLLGPHRVLCGDSTRREDVERVMGGQRARGVFTSPPFLQQRAYAGNMASDWHALLSCVFSAGLAFVEEDAQVFVNLGLVHRDGRVIRYWDSFLDDVESAGWPLFAWYVWDKLNGMPGDWNGRLAPAHEWIFHFARVADRPEKVTPSKNCGRRVGRTQRNPDGSLKQFTGAGDPIQPFKIPDSVIRLSPQKPDEEVNDHPAPFPVGLPAAFLEAWNGRDWYDPFLGSGTTLIAAHQLGRICYGLEIEPRYCDVIVNRWQNLTGETARRESAGTYAAS